MAISREAVAQLKQQADILQIIGEKVSLAPSGSGFKGLCPFHSEKSPSFTVNPSRGMFHCFGCGEGGSVIDFLMAYDRLSFPEAVTALARRMGVALPAGSEAGPVNKALDLLAEARGFYHELLASKPEGEAARTYLRGRGLEQEDWERFGIGFAPDEWRRLVGHATAKGFPLEEQVLAGLVKRSESGNAYDLLRKRVVFPILDPSGRAIAFGGRTIDSRDEPKYLNTPETRFYSKSKVLFGLAQGQETMRKGRRAILAEGYLDVIRLHMGGFGEAVATCGTALTADHLTLLERYVDRAVLVFDGDEAGVRAALRGAPLFLNRGLEARVVTLPDGLDPDDFLRQRGAEAFSAELERATPLLEFLVWSTLRKNGDTPAGKERTLEALAPMLGEISKDTARDVTIRFMADLIGVKADHITAMITPARAPRGGRSNGPGTGNHGEGADGQVVSLAAKEQRHQRMFLQVLLRERALLARAREVLQPEELTDAATRRLFEKMVALQDEEFLRLEPEELMELYPDVAPAVRSLLLDHSLGVQALEPGEAHLLYEAALIKEARKERLLQHLKRVAGTPEEELALRRYTKARDALRAMKSVPGARSLVAPATAGHPARPAAPASAVSTPAEAEPSSNPPPSA